MSCCTVRERPDSDISFQHLGCPCDTWAHLKDMFVYLKDERAGVIPCKPDEFTVQWTPLDAITYMYAVTDKLTGEVIEYSVVKEFPKESPERAFERDWRFRELVYNRGVIRAVEDLLEAMEETVPHERFKLERVPMKSYVIHKPIQEDLGVIVFNIEYDVERRDVRPFDKTVWNQVYQDSIIELPNVTDKVAYGTEVLMKRLRKIGVRFQGIEFEHIHDMKRFTIIGLAYRDEYTNTVIRIRYQEMDLNDPTLRVYHEYYTKKGPQNGYYIC